ncbi:MAG: GH3 auxin-responsive promoter family protein [Acidimicrobiales bacterium]
MTSKEAGAFSSAALDLVMRWRRKRLWCELIEQCAAPAETQADVLAEILASNADTIFGRQHGFGSIRGHADFARAVPVNDYEMLRPHIERQEATGEAVLTTEAPVLYAVTSGTTGEAKHIPVTPTGLRRQAKAQSLLATMVHAATGSLSGRILGIAGPAVEGYRPSGVPYGSASGMILESMPRLIRRRYVVPPVALGIADYDARYYVIAALALAWSDLTAIATANPSTLLRLRQVIVDRWPDLLDDLSSGAPRGAGPLDPGTRKEVAAALAAKGRRAAQLRAMGDPTRLTFGDLWPRLAAVTTWTAGSCGLAATRLRDILPETAAVVELGYLASEVRGTVAVDTTSRNCVPTLGDNFFEFVDRDAWERGDGQFRTLGELQRGRQYYVFVTTFDGLYRYDMNDIVEVTGTFGSTPCLAFVQKGRGVTNVTGEKLHESQVLEAVVAAGEGRVPGGGFFLMLADTPRAGYRLYLEGPFDRGELARLARSVDDALARLNIEYRSKRASGRLQPVVAHELRAGAGEAYRSHCVARGQRDAQFKVMPLQRAEDCTFDLAAAVVT